MRPASLRTWWLKAHRWFGLSLGGVLLLAAVTGALMTVARPLDAWLHPELFRVAPAPQAAAALPLEQVRRQLEAEFGAGVAFRLRPPREPGDSLWASVQGAWTGTVYFHPDTAAELGRRGEHEGLANWLFELHSNLLLGEAGKALLAATALAYLLLLVSGLVLWWPARWRHAFSLRLVGGTTRALFDLHRVGGALLGLAIAVSVLSGAYMAWRPLSAAVTALSGAQATAAPRPRVEPGGTAAPLDQLLVRARQALPGGLVGFVQVAGHGQPVRVRLRLPDDPHPNGLSSVWLHPATAQVLAVQRWQGLDPGARAYVFMYPLHIGELGGVAHLVLTGMLGLALAGFGATGVWLWWRRRR
ncbi:PepSY domain-containing protein [Ramlibacter sp. 2FC]|uniref:PepSY-associated TM helix domain-containing protein n=1 Tax=Ramlibacter sp. 2FC TaxID=2502188 RepID=UPI0010F7762A|nr:PepSY domain-containing protein [Ramlibacter sp. 2FC]